MSSESTGVEPQQAPPAAAPSGGPLNLEQIRRLRAEQTAAPRPPRREPRSPKAPAEPAVSEPTTPALSAGGEGSAAVEPGTAATSPETGAGEGQAPLGGSGDRGSGGRSGRGGSDRNKRRGRGDDDSFTAADTAPAAPRVPKPSIRQPLSNELEAELEASLQDADLQGLMIGDTSLPARAEFESGSRYEARVIKIHQDNVFVSLGGPDEGVIPLLQFTDMPQVDQTLNVIVRGFNTADGLYDLTLPGEMASVDDWSDIQEGLVVEAVVEGSNTGGLEAKVGHIRGFIPMRNISEYRIEDASAYIGQRLACVVLEANPRRGNLILSHRAVLERERQAKKAERLAALEVGQACQGTVRKITDFGAFVDIGGLDGLIHITQLSWDHVKHPSEVVKEGDVIQVRVEKIDAETGKIGLSYRALQDHPWDGIDARFPVGSVAKGTVSRLANFGAFVKLATGVEGLIHVSELAHRRIASVASVVEEGQEVEVKVLSVDRDAQRMSLSLKAVQAKPESEPATSAGEPVADEAPRAPVVAKHRGPLRGGTGSENQGERFGLKW